MELLQSTFQRCSIRIRTRIDSDIPDKTTARSALHSIRFAHAIPQGDSIASLRAHRGTRPSHIVDGRWHARPGPPEAARRSRPAVYTNDLRSRKRCSVLVTMNYVKIERLATEIEFANSAAMT